MDKYPLKLTSHAGHIKSIKKNDKIGPSLTETRDPLF